MYKSCHRQCVENATFYLRNNQRAKQKGIKMKGNIITNHTVGIKKTIRNHQQRYANKLRNLNEQEKFKEKLT